MDIERLHKLWGEIGLKMANVPEEDFLYRKLKLQKSLREHLYLRVFAALSAES